MRTSACAGGRQGSHGPWRMGRQRWSDCKSQGEGGPQLGQKRCVHREGETSSLERGCLFWELSHRCPGACGFRGPWPQTLCDLCNCFSQLCGPRASEGCAPGRCSKTSKPSGKEGDVCSHSQDVFAAPSAFLWLEGRSLPRGPVFAALPHGCASRDPRGER